MAAGESWKALQPTPLAMSTPRFLQDVAAVEMPALVEVQFASRAF